MQKFETFRRARNRFLQSIYSTGRCADHNNIPVCHGEKPPLIKWIALEAANGCSDVKSIGAIRLSRAIFADQRYAAESQLVSLSQSAGQELLSRNEELQLISEELETAKEELQSTNEELTTLNDELSNRNLEMMQLTSDLDNLLTSVQIPIVMVDRALMVRRATPAARNAFNILSTDIGRRITELRPNVDIPDLKNILRGVIETLGTRERKVSDKEGRGYALRVRPYCNTDNKIDGAVITLVDLEGKKDSYVGKTPHRAKQDSPRK